jgi:hypothetical protein
VNFEERVSAILKNTNPDISDEQIATIISETSPQKVAEDLVSVQPIDLTFEELAAGFEVLEQLMKINKDRLFY